jgi:type IV secretion system protein VirD4
MLLDEFAALGRIPIMGEAISYVPGYNVRVLLVVQSPAQLREVYGPHVSETMLKSLAARVFFAPKDYADAKEISDELGTTTVKARSLTRPRFARFGGKASDRAGNITVSDQRRPLLLPQEVKEIGTDTELILYEGLRPIRAKKIRYFRDRRFRERLLPPPKQAIAPSVHVSESTVMEERKNSAPTARAHSDVHPASLEDIENWESLTLDDFVDKFEFESTQVPMDRPPSDAELQAMADEFCSALRRA